MDRGKMKRLIMRIYYRIPIRRGLSVLIRTVAGLMTLISMRYLCRVSRDHLQICRDVSPAMATSGTGRTAVGCTDGPRRRGKWTVAIDVSLGRYVYP